ncbi:MAG: hypothetical protein IPK59_00420 [Rhodospirillaceae bacterium]|nr:hypothetical protein [Rhodospirillaceae bacterium]
MNKEHYWPRWLIRRTLTAHEQWRWLDENRIFPNSMTIPLCKDCNSTLGTELERPVEEAFDDLENGRGLTDLQAEQIVRWLWKFEGLAWMCIHVDDPNRRYSDLYTVRDRVLGNAIANLKEQLILAVSIIDRNDDGFTNWPIGLNSPISDRNSIFVSGVFSRIALIVSMAHLAVDIPATYSLYSFSNAVPRPTDKAFFPQVGFVTPNQAIVASRMVSAVLLATHEAEFADAANNSLMVPRRRVELP